MADFNFYLNRQGIQGKKGEKGDNGFSPVISEGQNTSDTYTLEITNEFETFETPNLRGQFSIEDQGGRYVLYDAENNTLSASDPILATSENAGVVSRAVEEDFLNVQETAAKFVNPYSLVNSMTGILDSPDDSVIIRQNPDTMRTELIVNGSIEGDIAQERAERIAADDLLRAGINDADSRIDNVISDLSTEQQIRLAADTQQQQQIDAERQERETQDAALQGQLGTKLTADNIKQGEHITITRDGNNITINSEAGGSTYVEGDGISIENNIISTKTDNQTIKIVDGVLHADFSEIGDEVNSLAGRMNTVENELGDLTERVDDLALFKFPNATIIGEPTINNGQITDFSPTNYLQFPFEFETKGRTWLLNGSFHTGSNVITQQNIIDSLASVALAVRSGRLVMALSTNGTSFDLGEHISMSDIEPNTDYYFRISFSGTQYLLSLSTDKIDYMPEAIVTSSSPIASRPMTISSSGHPYGSTINLNDWDLTVANTLVWQGMDDVGIASRADVNATNFTETGKENIREIAGVGNIGEVLDLLNGGDSTLLSTKADVSFSNINDNAKQVIRNVAGGGSGGSVDTELSNTSENAVQNKVIKEALDLKADKSELDGQWVNQPITLANSTEFDGTTKTYDLSDYLPNDNNIYEIYGYGIVSTGNVSGNNSSLIIGSDICNGSGVCRAVTRTSSSQTASGCFLLPIGLERSLIMSSASTVGTFQIVLRGYRRIK